MDSHFQTRHCLLLAALYLYSQHTCNATEFSTGVQPPHVLSAGSHASLGKETLLPSQVFPQK